jgi:hypothetical protein
MKEVPNKTPDSSMGASDWRVKDREAGNKAWESANLHNLQQSKGYEEYTTITQRTAIYHWFHEVVKAQGHEVDWVGAASIVAEQMSNLDNSFYAFILGEDIVKFGNEGNKAIFDDVFPRLRELYNMDKPLKGDAAKAWDSETLRHEQFDVVEPLYAKQSAKTLSTLESMAKGDFPYNFGVPQELRVDGDIRNPQDRYDHGMTKVVDFKKKYGSVANFYDFGKWYERSSGKPGDGKIDGVMDPDNPGLPKPWEPKY